ncbi:MAG: hypothetical protein U9Q70_05845 [Chloroflexota bacterium]|nr:hypothetical protein [Chloroflexota bacterium]
MALCTPTKSNPTTSPPRVTPEAWLSALPPALLLSALILLAYYYWFSLADRHLIFLYYHDMGPRVPSTAPFSPVTSSRYWMTGLVTGGIVLSCDTTLNWLLGRLRPQYQPPPWLPLWICSAAPLLIGLPWVTMTVNSPTLPALNAAQVTLAALAGVGLALLPGKLAAREPRKLILLAVDGWAVAGIILGLTYLDRVGQLQERGLTWPWLLVGGGVGGAIILLLKMPHLYRWLGVTLPESKTLFAAGLSAAYLLLPTLHHFVFTDGYYYFSGRANFFSQSWPAQIAAWLIAVGITVRLTRLRRT